MPLQPVRFLHAGNLSLGDPVRTAIGLDDRARRIAACATIRAWERVVDAAVEHRVDFLLLTGAPASGSDLGIAAETALEAGFDRLDEAGVDVVIVPGSEDAAEAWARQAVAADRVIAADDHEAVAVENRRGAPAALVLNLSVEKTWSDLPQDLLHVGAGESRIQPGDERRPQGLDYVASGSSGVWRQREGGDAHEIRLAATQPVRFGAAYPAGCLLGDVDEQGRLTVRRLQTASVRLCELSLALDGSSSLEDAALQMQDQIERLPADPNEGLRLIRWRVRGGGPLVASLGDDGGRSIDAAWRSDFAPRDDLPVLAEFVAEVSDAAAAIALHETSSARREIDAGINDAVESLGEDWQGALEPLLSDRRLRESVASRVSPERVRRQAAAFVRRPVSVSGSEDYIS